MKTVSGKLALLVVLAIPIAIEAAQQQPRQSTQPHVQPSPSRGAASGGSSDDGSVVRRTITKEDEEHEARGTAPKPPPRRAPAPVVGDVLDRDLRAQQADAEEIAGDSLRGLADTIESVSRDLNSIPEEQRPIGESNPSELYGPFDRTGDRASSL